MRVAKTFTVVQDFDFSPRANVVLTYRAGTEQSKLTRACIKRGLELKAIVEITQEDEE